MFFIFFEKIFNFFFHFLAANGEFSDFQEVTKKLKEVDKKSRIFDDNINHTPKDFANYLGMLSIL